MKDLYAQLGIDRTANAEEIAASARQRPDLEDRASILLDAGKRAVYDRAHAALKLIGELRRRLHLDAQDSWFARNHADFAARSAAPAASAAAPAAQPAPATPQSAPAKPTQEPAARSEAARGAPHPNQPLSARLVLTIAVALGVLAAIAYFLIPR